MPKPSSSLGDDSTIPGMPDEWVRSVVSIVIFIHLFCCGVAMCANFGRSALEDRLLDVLAPYSQLVHQDLGYAQYQLTNGYGEHEAFLEIQPDNVAGKEAGEVLRLPAGGLVGGLPYLREQQLAARLSAFAANGDDTSLSVAAKSIGAAAMKQNNWNRIVIRVRRHRTQPLKIMEAQPAPTLAESIAEFEKNAYEMPYQAVVKLDVDGTPLINKIEASGESAPVTKRK